MEVDFTTYYTSTTTPSGTDVEYTWDPKPSTLTFSSLASHTIQVRADNALSQPQTVTLVVEVVDQEFGLGQVGVESEVRLEQGGEEFLLTGVGVQITCNITGGQVTSTFFSVCIFVGVITERIVCY